jgi:ATP-binding cassette subfamily F protein 3
MLLEVNIRDKTFGDTTLYKDLEFSIEEGQKIGLIGRNGTGKSTLLNMIAGTDKDFDGVIQTKKNTSIVASRQEHHDHEDKKVIDYIVSDLPEFSKLKHILDTYPEHMGENSTKLHAYSDALERFTQLGYFEVEGEIETALEQYQVGADKAHGLIKALSGGQKRMVELVKVQRANADLALIDEPTNHMDYVAKNSFIDWLKQTDEAVVVITHDRDVLKYVTRIIEIRDGKADIFKGNYDDYLRINANTITAEVNQYTVVQSRIKNLQSDVVRFRRLKEKARNPGTIHRFKSLERKASAELDKLENTDKPSFWIDKDSVKNINKKVSESYEELKTRNIRITTKSKPSRSSLLLVEAKDIELTYAEDTLFQPISFQLREGDRLELHGRNGVGKTTLARHIILKSMSQKPESIIVNGEIDVDKSARVGVYEQELDSKHMKLTMAEAIEAVHDEKDIPITAQKIKQLMGDYLFNPMTDGDKPMSKFSGGQKARFQLMNMLAGDPNILILDEPTNHLDLPSIEELDEALNQYHGAIIYISHDSYFSESLGGKVIQVAA